MATKDTATKGASNVATVKATPLGEHTLSGVIVKYGKGETLYTVATLGGRSVLRFLLAFAYGENELDVMVTIYDRPAARAAIIENLEVTVKGNLSMKAATVEGYSDNYYLGPITKFQVIDPQQ